MELLLTPTSCKRLLRYGTLPLRGCQESLLPTFAAVFLSTAILEPGRFNPLGTLLGIYFLATGILGLQLLGLQAWVSQVFYGGILVIAVTISTLLRRRST